MLTSEPRAAATCPCSRQAGRSSHQERSDPAVDIPTSHVPVLLVPVHQDRHRRDVRSPTRGVVDMLRSSRCGHAEDSSRPMTCTRTGSSARKTHLPCPRYHLFSMASTPLLHQSSSGYFVIQPPEGVGLFMGVHFRWGGSSIGRCLCCPSPLMLAWGGL